jgi:hypothetical protein
VTIDHAQYEQHVLAYFSLLPETAFEYVPCLFCGPDGTKQGYRLFHKNTMIVSRCQCGFVFNHRQPTQETLSEFYFKSLPMAAWSELKKSPKEAERQTEKYSKAIQFLAPRIKSLLDMGCGNGKFLSLMKAKDPMLVLKGMETNLEARTAALDAGLWVGDQSLDEFSQDNGFTWDAISLWGVLEHLKKPKESLEKLARHMSPGGYLVVCVPNVASAVVQALWEECATFCPQHLWYFDVDSLYKLVDQAGFEPVFHYTIEPEHIPITKRAHGFKPYEKLPAWAEEKYIDSKPGYMDRLSEYLLEVGKGYKIVLIAQLKDEVAKSNEAVAA